MFPVSLSRLACARRRLARLSCAYSVARSLVCASVCVCPRGPCVHSADFWRCMYAPPCVIYATSLFLLFPCVPYRSCFPALRFLPFTAFLIQHASRPRRASPLTGRPCPPSPCLFPLPSCDTPRAHSTFALSLARFRSTPALTRACSPCSLSVCDLRRGAVALLSGLFVFTLRRAPGEGRCSGSSPFLPPAPLVAFALVRASGTPGRTLCPPTSCRLLAPLPRCRPRSGRRAC